MRFQGYLRKLFWSLSLDVVLLAKVDAISLGDKLRLIFFKYWTFLSELLRSNCSSPSSVSLFGKVFYYHGPYGLASLQRVYCASYRLKKLLPPNPVVIDVGANIGQFNFFCAHYLGARRIVSVEPIPDCLDLLKKNALSSEDCFGGAVSDRVGEVVFHISPVSSQLSSYIGAGGGEGTMTVPTRTLDDLAKSAGLERVDLVKVDTEGSEFDVLASGRETLAKSAWVLVEMSVLRESSGNLFRIGTFLEERGFRLVGLQAGSAEDPEDMDGLFRKR